MLPNCQCYVTTVFLQIQGDSMSQVKDCPSPDLMVSLQPTDNLLTIDDKRSIQSHSSKSSSLETEDTIIGANVSTIKSEPNSMVRDTRSTANVTVKDESCDTLYTDTSNLSDSLTTLAVSLADTSSSVSVETLVNKDSIDSSELFEQTSTEDRTQYNQWCSPSKEDTCSAGGEVTQHEVPSHVLSEVLLEKQYLQRTAQRLGMDSKPCQQSFDLEEVSPSYLVHTIT